jgi:hypothetical protein
VQCWVGAGFRVGDDRSVSPLAGYIDLLVGVGMQTIRARRQKGCQAEWTKGTVSVKRKVELWASQKPRELPAGPHEIKTNTVEMSTTSVQFNAASSAPLEDIILWVPLR